MIKGAIFDLDGTLLDSMHVWDNIGQDYLQTKNIQPPPDLLDSIRSLSLYQCAQYFHEHLGVDVPVEEMMGEVNRMVEGKYIHEVPLKPYVKEFLEQLNQQGVRLCVCTASDRYMVEAALRRLGVWDYFDFLMTCTEEGLAKDTPEIFQRALEKLGTDKADTIIFEDAAHAVRTAAGAGFRVVAMYDKSAAMDAEEIRALSEQYLMTFADFKEDQA